MSEILNLSALCRCCHTTGNLKSLNLSYSFKGETEVYADMLNKTFGLMLCQPSIEASHSICAICIEKLRNALEFKEQVEHCEMMFKDYCKNELVHETEIKIEKQDTGEEIMIKSEMKIKIEDIKETSHDQKCTEFNGVDIEISNIDPNNYEEKVLNTEDQQKNCLEQQKTNLPKTMIRRKNYIVKKHDTLNAEIRRKQRLEKQKSLISKAKLIKRKNCIKKRKLTKSGPENKPRKKYKCAYRRLKTDNGVVFICTTCEGTFETRQYLILHIEKQHSLFTCNICRKTFHGEEVLKRHTLSHNRFECNICGNSFKHLGTLVIHKNTHTREKVFTCDMCNKNFLYKSTLIKHIAFHLGRNKKFICDICGNSFNDKTNLNIHVRNVHEKLRLFKCGVCPKIYASNKTLSVHLRIHTGERPYKCQLCDKAFVCSSALRRHTEKYHTSKQKCIYTCEICGKVTYSRGGFAAHTRSHIGAKPYKCHICEKDFTCKYTQRRHIESHQGANIFPCEICHKTFSGKATLQRHIKNLHDPNKRLYTQKIKCELCKMSVSDMEKHLISHGKSHLCSYCPKSYSEVSALNRHIKERHLGLSHDCDLCDKKYIKARSLRTHKLKKHNIQFKLEQKDDQLSENEKILEQ